MKRAFVLIAVAMLYCNTTLAQEPDPDPNLLWTTEDSYQRFLVHPNGNIFAGKYSTEVELDGNTGEVIREFPYQVIIYDISPDGKYISALTDQRCVIDYETQEVVVHFTNENTSPKFMPDSRTLIYDVLQESGNSFSTKLATYNIETGRYRFSPNPLEQTAAWNINVSPDGKFFATGGIHQKYGDDYTRLVLWDAHTLEPIRVLGEFEEFNEVRSIKFSQDSRLVGFMVYEGKMFIYNTEDYTLKRHYDRNIDVEFVVHGFCFLPNNLLAYGNVLFPLSDDPKYTKIEDLNTSELLYNDRILGSNAMEYNPRFNNWLVKRSNIYCYDLEKILSGASIVSAVSNPFMVEYMNNTLLIKNYNFTSVQITAQIADINGKMIRQLVLNTSTGEIRIPLKLLSGTYFLHIKDGGKEYVSKFLVVN